MVMDLNNTIKTFECCTQKPPDCANCPEKGPGFGFACKQDVIENVLYWLNEYKPDWGSPVRYNCPFWRKTDECCPLFLKEDGDE